MGKMKLKRLPPFQAVTFHPDGSTVHFEEPFGQRQAQAGSRCLVVFAAVYLVKFIEYLRLFLGRNADTVVLH